MESTGLALPPTISILSPSTSRDWTLWKKAVFFPSLWLLVGWIMFLQLAYCMNVIQHCHFHFHVSSMSAPTTIPHMPCRLCIFNVFFFFFFHCSASCNPSPSLSPSFDQGQCWGFVKPMQGDSDRQESEACVMQGCCCCCWGSSPQRLWPR